MSAWTWLPAAVTGFGMLINLAWSVVNMQIRADIARRDEALREWVRQEFVSHPVCAARMGSR